MNWLTAESIRLLGELVDPYRKEITANERSGFSLSEPLALQLANGREIVFSRGVTVFCYPVMRGEVRRDKQNLPVARDADYFMINDGRWQVVFRKGYTTVTDLTTYSAPSDERRIA